MNKSLLTTIAIIAITVLVFSACKRNTSNGSQSQITDTEEGFSAGFDPSALLDGELWFTEVNTGLKVTFATQDILNLYENYATYNDAISPLELKIIFTSDNAIDLEFLGIRWEYNEAREYYFPIANPMASSIVRHDRPFVVNWEEQGSLPHRAVAFYDRNEVKRYFSISLNNSGEGAPVILAEIRLDEQQAAGELPSQHYNAADIIRWWRFESGSHLLFFQSNMTVEFISDGSVKVYFVTESEAYSVNS